MPGPGERVSLNLSIPFSFCALTTLLRVIPLRMRRARGAHASDGTANNAEAAVLLLAEVQRLAHERVGHKLRGEREGASLPIRLHIS